MKSASLFALTVFSILLSPTFVDAQKGWKSYTVVDEYSFQYPSNWKLEQKENRFTSIDARLEYGNKVVRMAFGGGIDEKLAAQSDDQTLERLQEIMEQKGNIFESGIDKQMANNGTAPYVIGTYSTKSLFGKSFSMVELLTSVRLPNNEIVIVEYHAEENDFDKYLPKVKQVINSITPIGAGE